MKFRKIMGFLRGINLQRYFTFKCRVESGRESAGLGYGRKGEGRRGGEGGGRRKKMVEQ
jgi:hypothetical protein